MSRGPSKFLNGRGLFIQPFYLHYPTGASRSLPNKFIMLMSTTNTIVIIPLAYVIPSSCQRIRRKYLRAVLVQLCQDCLDLPTSSVLRHEPVLPFGLQCLFLDA